MAMRFSSSRSRPDFPLALVMVALAALSAPLALGAEGEGAELRAELANLDAETKRYVPPEREGGKWNGYYKANEQLIGDGKYHEATVRLLWFYENILEYRPSMVGVRNSFALSQWKQLGEAYPLAAAALRDARDTREAYLRSGQARVTIPVYKADGTERDFRKEPPTTEEGWTVFFKSAAGDRPYFEDVAALNRELGDGDRTLDLFRQLDRDQPEFAKTCINYADKILIEKGEYALAKKYIDIAADWDFYKDLIRRDLASDNPRIREGMVGHHRETATRRVVLARATGEPELADRIEKEVQALFAKGETAQETF